MKSILSKQFVLTFLIYVCILISCNSSQTQQEKKTAKSKAGSISIKIAKPTKHIKPISTKHDSLIVLADSSEIYYWNRGEGMLYLANPISIQSRNWLRDNFILPKKNREEKILRHLFGGRFYTIFSDEHNDTDRFVCWTRPRFKKIYFPELTCEGDTIIFPQENGSETRIIKDTIWNQPDGKKYRLYSFSTSGISEDFNLWNGGHLTKAALGLALFELKNKNWELITFSPFVTFSGEWSEAMAPHILVTGFSSFVIVAPDYCMGGGSPTWDDATLFAVVDNQFKQVSDRLIWGIGNRETSWSSSIVPENKITSEEQFPSLIFKSSGSLYSANVDEVGEYDDVPEAKIIFEKFVRNAIFTFHREKTLGYKNGKYREIKVVFTADTTGIEPPKYLINDKK